jgi:ABC-type oligopeptide transport system substrate-binding subunit
MVIKYKTMKSLTKIFCTLMLMTSCFYVAGAQTKTEKKAAKVDGISKLINNKNYVFKANMANPSGGIQSRVLTSDYDLTVSKDTIVAYLPYFGRAYLTDYNSATDGGIKFTSTDFSYKLIQNKKGSYEILITPKSSLSDPRAVQSMRLYVSPDGYASLQVTSLNRDPISFDGVVQEKDKPKG